MLFPPTCDGCGEPITDGETCGKFDIAKSLTIPLPRDYSFRVQIRQKETVVCNACGFKDLADDVLGDQ